MKENNSRPIAKQQGQVVGPCVMVIFGASGDLTKRKLMPAIYNLAKQKLLPENFAVLGVSRTGMSDEDFRQKISAALKEFSAEEVDKGFTEWLFKRLYYLSGDVADEKTYVSLKQRLGDIDREHGTGGNYLFYLATMPAFFSVIVRQLGESRLALEEEGKWRRVIIEKPFGHDLDSARLLNREIAAVLDENQIYRIDHYLGKETVQNIMVFRFANGIFEPIWNRRYIDHVEVTVAEDIGVEQRGGYYEGTGALRDMVPNHIFQLITLTAMEPPISFEANAIRDEQAKIMNAIQPMTPEEVLSNTVRGQYGEGEIEGKRVTGYRSEKNVSPESYTETFVAIKLFIDNWRWAEVPFYLRTGKRLHKRVTEIAIQFKQAPFVLFRQTSVDHLTSNRLVIRIHPDEGISLSFGAKIPGPVMTLGAVNMNFEYKNYFGHVPSTGYERLLYDCMLGDATLFLRADMAEAGWSVVEPILDVWKALPPRTFPNYPAGADGPKEADDLLLREGRRWNVCD